jgi:EAL domain-containing protein (putative c-di-GMP-specific phosphodiesterase class I)
VIADLQAFRDMGVRLSVDDFGTGYSSLSYLKRFPVNRLKIDQSFVRDITSDADDAAIAQAVITLGHTMNLRVIAEGVETAEQLAFLRRNQCDEMQGYLFGKPMPAEAFAQLLGSGRTLPP